MISLFPFPRDKFNEIKVQEVKLAIARQHSALRDLQIQTLIRSLSVMTALHVGVTNTILLPTASSIKNSYLQNARIGYFKIVPIKKRFA